MMDGFDHNSSHRSADLRRPSPSYFKNVVSLDGESMSSIPSPRLSKQKSMNSTTEKGGYRFHFNSTQFRPTNLEEDTNRGSIKDGLFPPETLDISDKGNQHDKLIPLAGPTDSYNPPNNHHDQDKTPLIANVRSRKGNLGLTNQSQTHKQKYRRRRRKRRSDEYQHSSGSIGSDNSSSSRCSNWCFGSSCGGIFWCCNDRKIVRSTLSCMNVVARILSWCTVVASVAGVVWYSYELKKTG